MISLNETEQSAAEVPCTLPLISDPLTGLTGHVWTDQGDGTTLEWAYTLPGSATVYYATISRIREIGYGRFALRLIALECTTEGLGTYAVNVVTAQPAIGTYIVGTGSGEINVGGTGYLVAYLPDEVDPIYGTPASGAFASLTGALWRVAWPDTAYATMDNADVVSLGNGMYGYPVTVAESAVRGNAYFYVEADGFQHFESYVTILSAIEIIPTPVDDETPDPVEAIYTAADPEYLDHAARAISRLCEYAKAKAVA